MKTELFILICGILALATTAQNTTRRGLKPAAEPSAMAADKKATLTDTVVSPEAHTIDINGYDKPLRSRRETFFATNNSKRTTEAIAVTITYFDKSHRQLHERKASLPLVIPAGETRQASLKSWDSQLSFYYIRSSVPARAEQATPYEVKITVDTIFFAR